LRSFTLFFLFAAAVSLGLISANQKKTFNLKINSIQLGMNEDQIYSHFGEPFAKIGNVLTYILDDSSELTISFRDGAVSSAQYKFKNPPRIKDSKLKKLTLVQMQSEESYNNRPTWFFAGNPKDGLIYKVTSQGNVESLTWVPPFSYGNYQPKQLQALLKDFHLKQSAHL